MDAIQSALLSAVDYLVEEKTNQLSLDKTVVAIVVGTQDVLKNIYQIRYNGNDKLTAKAVNGETYQAGQAVYVLVPQNDLSKDKMIIGVASSSESQEISSFVSSIMDDFTYVGGSMLVPVNSDSANKTVNLHSWRESDAVVAYLSDQFKDELKQQVGGDFSVLQSYKYDANEGKACAKNAKKLLVRAKFRTNLTGKHKLSSCGGEYGIQVIASFKTDRCYKIKYDVDGSGNKTVAEIVSALEKTGYSDDRKTYVGDLEYETKQRLFSLDTSGDTFTGQPFNYPDWSTQYAVFDFDAENFVGIEGVTCYSKGFQPTESAYYDIEDIFVKNIEVYGLTEVSSVNGDYSLRLSPKTLTFKAKNDDGVSDAAYAGNVKAVFKKKSLSLSQNSNSGFWWGRENKAVTGPMSPGYHAYLSAGWEYLDNKGKTSMFETTKAENRAYENKYRCAAVYMSDDGEKVALRDEFIVYNLESKRDIQITSDLGTDFAFDLGTPMLTCFVDGYEQEQKVKDENGTEVSNGFSNYAFYWSIEQQGESRDILSAAEAQERLDQVSNTFKDPNQQNASYADLAQAQANVKLAAGVKYGRRGDEGDTSRNHLQLPISSVYGSAVVTCTVYMLDPDGSSYCIGNASITLRNTSSVDVAQYHIIIENGNQSFQYSEAGVSPCKADYNGLTTQEIFPLSCHFYDPSGLEIDEAEYSVEWSVPVRDTFFTFTADINSKNDAADTGEKVIQTRSLEFGIQDSWRYAYTFRQITAIVTYKGDEFRKDTEFVFSKVGDNGTNGTEYVLKLIPDDDGWYPFETAVTGAYYERNYLPSVVLYNSNGNLSMTGNNTAMEAVLYKSGIVDTARDVKYSLATSGPKTKQYPFAISADGKLGLAEGIGLNGFDFAIADKQKNREFLGLILNATGKVNTDGDTWDTIYASYPMPVVVAGSYVVSFDRKYTLQEVLYNSDGKYPQYDADKGIKVHKIYSFTANTQGVSFKEVDDYSQFSIALSLVGGVNDLQEGTSDLNSISPAVQQDVEDGVPDVLRRRMVTPNEVYSGLYQNNAIKVVIKKGGNETACVAYVPIYMSLNRYSLASLNAWDGNSVKVNDNGKESYLLAPQIGAGIKGDDNSFTGMVMGASVVLEEDADGNVSEDRQVGLLGYAKGKQSVFIDSESGNATFGLRSEDFTDSDDYDGRYSGRIELRPWGRSKIANLVFAQNAMYGVSKPIDGYRWEDKGREERTDTGSIKYVWPADSNVKPVYTITSSNGLISQNVENVDLDAYKAVFQRDTEIGEPYSDYSVAGASFGIPHDSEGIIISSLPAYISIKGHPLTRYNSDIDWENSNRKVSEGDCLELEMDPGKSSLFTIYRHYKQGQNEDVKYHREPMVGIDSTGRFYTNSLRDGSASMNINEVGAFGFGAASDVRGSARAEYGYYPNYIGVNFSYGSARGSNKPIVKIFQATANGTRDDDPENLRANYTYITKGSGLNDEYSDSDGGIRVNAYGVELYAAPNTSGAADKVKATTNCCLAVNTDSYFLGSKDKSNLSIDAKQSVVVLKNTDSNILSIRGDNVLLKRADNSLLEMSNGNTSLCAGENKFLKMNGASVALHHDGTHYIDIKSSTIDINSNRDSMSLGGNSFSLKINSIEKIKADTSSIVINGNNNGSITVQDTTLRIYGGKQGTAGTVSISSYSQDFENTIEMDGSKFSLTSGKGSGIDVYYDFVTNRLHDHSGVLVRGSLGISGGINGGDTNNAICFASAPGGLRVDRYVQNNSITDTYRIIRNTNKDSNHCLEIGGHVLIEGSTKVTETLAANSLTIGEKSGMNEGWFNEIQSFYDGRGQYALRSSLDIYATKAEVSSSYYRKDTVTASGGNMLDAINFMWNNWGEAFRDVNDKLTSLDTRVTALEKK